MTNFRSIQRRLMIAILMVGCLGCAMKIVVSPSPIQLAGARAVTIVVAPLNIALELPETLSSSTGLVSETLVTYLRDSEKVVHAVDNRTARLLWIQSTRDVSRAGEAENFGNGVRALARRLSQTIKFDALIIPSLYLQNARIQTDSIARWDGANQKIEFVGHSRWKIDTPDLTTIGAASILLNVFDESGNPIHSKRTGLELIQHLRIEKTQRKGRDRRIWVLADDAEGISDPIRVKAALSHALSPFISKGLP